MGVENLKKGECFMLKSIVLFCLFLFSGVTFAEMSKVDYVAYYRYSLNLSKKTVTKDYNKFLLLNSAFRQLLDEITGEILPDYLQNYKSLQGDVYVDLGLTTEKHFTVDYWDYVTEEDYLDLLVVARYYGVESTEFLEYKNYFTMKIKNYFLLSHRLEGVDSTKLYVYVQSKPIIVGTEFKTDLYLYTKNNYNFHMCGIYDKLGIPTCSSFVGELEPINNAYSLYAYKKMEVVTGNIFTPYQFNDVYNVETGIVYKMSSIDMTRVKMLVSILFPGDTLRMSLINSYVLQKHRYDLMSSKSGVGPTVLKNGYWITEITR